MTRTLEEDVDADFIQALHQHLLKRVADDLDAVAIGVRCARCYADFEPGERAVPMSKYLLHGLRHARCPRTT